LHQKKIAMENIFDKLPNPVDVLLHPVSLLLMGMYVALMVWEALFPARKLPYVRYWKIKGIAAFLVYFMISSYFPMLWNQALSGFQVFNLTSLGTWWGAAAAVLSYELALHVWHSTLHKSDTLWKIFHQMHHSAERIDTYGAFYFNITDMIGFTFMTSLALVVVAGFTPEATTLALITITFLSIFQHSNIRTPVWLGYIIQRPEGHTLHHAKGIHAYNYCDLSFIDMMFGTFKNPKAHKPETGFYDGASGKMKDMLLFRDISSEDKI
jgi:sterol desaturase/sphingolipid hydroxylase (fatty acid hydroxylase superfamily)